MDYSILIILILIGLVILLTWSMFTSNRKLKLKIERSFGKTPVDQDYDVNSISSFHSYMDIAQNNSNWIDEITWNDLDMDKIFKQINMCCSSVGEEYLYHLLHTQYFHTDELNHREKFIAYLKSNESQRLNLQMILSKLGKKEHNGLSALVNNMTLKQLKCAQIYNFLALIPCIGAIMAFFIPSVGVGILIASFTVNIMIHYKLKRKIEFDLITLEYFGALLWCCKKLCKLHDSNLNLFLLELENNFKVFKPLCSKFPTVSKNGFSDVEIFTEYIKILFLSDIRGYNKTVKSITSNIDCFQEIYNSIGEIDASISVLSFRESLPFFCTPQFKEEEKSVIFKEIYHPLLSSPVANSADIHNSCIITGSNASGKSTFIKAVAINCILAQTINTCTARSYTANFSLAITSMAVRDNISEGDSYFVTEIKSLKRILDKVSETHCFCFIDEILKGTNTIERIAASTAVLKYLNKQNCLCMVASHDIELTEILKCEYDNYHFSEQIENDGVYFDYRLKQGASQTRNAIKLLHFLGFEDEVVEDAEALVDKFTANHKWVD